jgi:Domain of unknown function (DUF4124)
MKTTTLWLAIFCLGFSLTATADPVYRWEAPNGSVHYSSKPPHQGAKPADLPPIMKGDIKLSKTYFISCDQHGGLNCNAGADQDGSVICNDGFKNSSLRHKKVCGGDAEARARQQPQAPVEEMPND